LLLATGYDGTSGDGNTKASYDDGVLGTSERRFEPLRRMDMDRRESTLCTLVSTHRSTWIDHDRFGLCNYQQLGDHPVLRSVIFAHGVKRYIRYDRTEVNY
jgi:hypothetical protein